MNKWIQVSPGTARLLMSAVVMAGMLGVVLSAADTMVLNYCDRLEPWSALWILGGCWAV